jgi:hypothetical protein
MTQTTIKTFDMITDEPIVSMVIFNGSPIIATPHQLYRLHEGKMIKLEFEYVEN